MKSKTLRWLAGLVVGLGGAASTFVSCSEPATECQTGLYTAYVATFTVKGSVPSCWQRPAPEIGDLVGAEFYHPPTADGKSYDDTKTSFAIHTQTMGKLQRRYSDDVYPDMQTGIPFTDGIAGDSPNAIGAFTSTTPDSSNFCYVNMTSPAQEDFTQQDGGAPHPELKYSDAWSNLKFYVTAAVPGNQFSGDLTRTENGCSIQYHVVGMWPQVPCSGADPNDGHAIPDITQCSPCANPDAGMATGSGINPNFPVACTALFDPTDEFGRGGACANLQTDPTNCGGCGVACGAYQTCNAGSCTCTKDAQLCTPDMGSGLPPFCTNLQSDAANCGTCFNACGPNQACSKGKCVDDVMMGMPPMPVPKCDTGLTACGASCVDTNTDSGNCGGCGMPCTNGTCAAGVCTCATGLTLCDGSNCADLSSDPANCGMCDNACGAGQTCNKGKCELDATCPSGLALCGTPFYCTLTGGDPPQVSAPEPACALATQ